MSISISSFTAWITIEGAECPIYGLKKIEGAWLCDSVKPGTRGQDATCWIASEEGKKFSVNWSNKHRERPVCAQLSIDGVICSTYFMLDAYNYPEYSDDCDISYATTSDFTRRDFVFSAIRVTDDDAYLFTLDNPPAFGTIRLELWDAHIHKTTHAPYRHSQVLESQVIHEKSKKAGAHHVIFGEEYVPQTAVNLISGTLVGAAPRATFVFNYRPFDMLVAAGIIPRVALPRQQVTVKSESVHGRIENLEVRLQAVETQLASQRAQTARSRRAGRRTDAATRARYRSSI